MNNVPSILIRPASTEDIPAIQKISYKLFSDPTSAADLFSDYDWPQDERGFETIKAGIENPGNIFLVAQLEDDLVGYLWGFVAETQGWRPIKRTELTSFFVDSKYRSQGIGRQLTQQFLMWSKQQDAVTAYVEAYYDNERGIDFYKRMGFEPESICLEIILDESKKLRQT